MPSQIEQGTFYGNLRAYKQYIRPNAYQLTASDSANPKNRQKILNLLRILTDKGSCTTWEMAKIQFPNDVSKLRNREKEYRRFIVGRNDRGKHYSGLLELGIVVKDGTCHERAPANKYRLSLHGILFCINALKLSDGEIDRFAHVYGTVLPRIFGKWEHLKKLFDTDVYQIRILSKGILLENMQIGQLKNMPFLELMMFLHLKYSAQYESIEESDLAEQISYWFYTIMVFFMLKRNPRKDATKITFQDNELNDWYRGFHLEAKQYYENRLSAVLDFNLD